MPTDRSEKRIYELQTLSGSLKSDSYFAVSQDNLTRKVTLKQLQTAFSENGDYYTSKQIDQLIEQIYDRIKDFDQDILNLTKITEALKDRIEEVRNELLDQIKNINNVLDNLYRYGTNPPTELEEGQFYFQYFEESTALPILSYYYSKNTCIIGPSEESEEGEPTETQEIINPDGYYDFILDFTKASGSGDSYNYHIGSIYYGTDGFVNEGAESDTSVYMTIYSDDTYTEDSVLVEETEISTTTDGTDDEEGYKVADGTINIPNSPDLIYVKLSKKVSGTWDIFPDETITSINQYGFAIRTN